MTEKTNIAQGQDDSKGNFTTNTRAHAREEALTLIFSRIASGESMNKVCLEDGMPSRQTLFTWIAGDEDVQRRYELALRMRSEVHAEQIIDIADDGTNDSYTDGEGNKRIDHDVIARSKLRVDARKWHMSKMNPKKYGDKITQELTGAGGGAIRVDTMSDEQLLQIASRAAPKAE